MQKDDNRCIFPLYFDYLIDNMQVSALQIAHVISGKVIGDPEVKVSSPAGIEQASSDQISFLGNLKYEAFLYESDAGVIIVPDSLTIKKETKATLIQVPDVYLALATLFNLFSPKEEVVPEIAPSAHIAPGALISQTARIEHGAVIEEGAVIGDRVLVGAQSYIGVNSVVGEDTTLYPGVKIYKNCTVGRRCILHSNAVIGSDGFGFARDPNGNFIKIPHLGSVLIGDDVEIGANAAIDRGSMGNTKIGNGVKIDNLVHIAHNVHIGDRSALAAQVGIAGSTQVGAECMFGGQAGISGHLEIADGTQLQAQSGLAGSVKSPQSKLFGSPAFEYSKFVRAYTIFKNLPELWRKVLAIEKQLSDKDKK